MEGGADLVGAASDGDGLDEGEAVVVGEEAEVGDGNLEI